MKKVGPNILVKRGVRELVKTLGCSIDKQTIDEVEAVLAKAIETAVKRAQANGRKTLRSWDL